MNKGKQTVTDAVEALGGTRFTSMKNRVESGRGVLVLPIAEVTGRDIATIDVEVSGSNAGQGTSR